MIKRKQSERSILQALDAQFELSIPQNALYELDCEIFMKISTVLYYIKFVLKEELRS